MRPKWQIDLVPGSHLDYGWAASPGECLAYVSEVIRTAVEDLTEGPPEFRFTLEYVLFVRHFLETYPEYEEALKRLIDEGRLEVCTTMTGPIEQWLDGEMLIHQLTRGKRWVRERLGYDPKTAQHTDLPGHIIQIPQFLQGIEVENFAYSRFRPPVPLHIWRAPDGSEVLACCHNHEDYRKPGSWEGYGWGWFLFVNNKDVAWAEERLLEGLKWRDTFWPPNQPVLMGCESDLQPSDPTMVDRVAQWNERHPEAPIRFCTISEFFRGVKRKGLPVYQGEAPYSFFALPAIYIAAAQNMRRGDNAVTAAEKWTTFAEWQGLGRAPRERILAARDALFLPHDHNTGGRRGEINDAERINDARTCRLEGESMLQEAAMRFTVHINYRRLKEGVYPITVFNSLSWERDDVVETYIELPMTGVKSLNITDSKGRPVPSQILEVDEQMGHSRIYLVFVAPRVPSHGYETFYVRPSTEAEPVDSSLEVSEKGMQNAFFDIRVKDKRIASIKWKGRELIRQAPRGFNEIYVREDRQSNVEAPPWDIENTYTGKEWDSRVDKVEMVESGPVRAVLRFTGRAHTGRFTQDVILYDALERVDFRHTLDYKAKMHTMTRVAYPLRVPGGTATYESPYAAVRLEEDEMRNTFRGHGERWVQKWIDISNEDYGVTLATRQTTHAVANDGIEPILARTAVDCGTIFYYYDQDGAYTFDFSLTPHEKDWKDAAGHRAGWAFNSPLDSCNWTTCFPIRPLRRSRRLPERDSFLQVDKANAVVTAIAPSRDDPEAYVVRLVEYHGKSGTVRLRFGSKVARAEEVNFLERRLRRLEVRDRTVSVKVKPCGIHSIRVKLQKSDGRRKRA